MNSEEIKQEIAEKEATLKDIVDAEKNTQEELQAKQTELQQLHEKDLVLQGAILMAKEMYEKVLQKEATEKTPSEETVQAPEETVQASEETPVEY